MLGKEIDAGRIMLHFTDITLAEIRRQLAEEALAKAAEAKRLAHDFNRMAQIAGLPNETVKQIDDQ